MGPACRPPGPGYRDGIRETAVRGGGPPTLAELVRSTGTRRSVLLVAALIRRQRQKSRHTDTAMQVAAAAALLATPTCDGPGPGPGAGASARARRRFAPVSGEPSAKSREETDPGTRPMPRS
jgi:hypothetical protein